MTQISSRMTFFTKWAFPVVWVGILLTFTITALGNGTARSDPGFLLVPLFMVVVGFFIFRFLVWNLADSVLDYGSYLVAKRRGVEVRIPLENVMNVSSSMFSNPRQVTLRLVQASALGNEIAFIPKGLFINPFARSEVAEDLTQRAYAARTKPKV